LFWWLSTICGIIPKNCFLQLGAGDKITKRTEGRRIGGSTDPKDLTNPTNKLEKRGVQKVSKSDGQRKKKDEVARVESGEQ